MSGRKGKAKKGGPRAAAPIETEENIGRSTRATTTHHIDGSQQPKKGMVSVASQKKGRQSGKPAAAPSTPPQKRSTPRNAPAADEETPTTPNTRARAAAAAANEVVPTNEPRGGTQTVGGSRRAQQGRKQFTPPHAASLPNRRTTLASKDDDDDDDEVDYDNDSTDYDDEDDNDELVHDEDGEKKMPAVGKKRTLDNIQKENDGGSVKKKARTSLNEIDVSHGHQLTKVGREFVLDAIIKEEVYARTKFPDKNALSFSNNEDSICQFMAKKLKIPDNEVELWWRDTKKHVHQALTKLRNNSIKGIKKLFQGKKAT